MHSPALRAVTLVLFLLASAGLPLRADPPPIAGVLEPKTAAEAWNVIRLATRNVDRLIEENRLAEIPVQASYCSPALRTLARVVTDPAAAGHVGLQTTRAIGWLGAIARAAGENNPASVKESLAKLRLLLDDIAHSFDPKTVGADIFFCPMHSDFRSENAKTPCAKCGMDLLARRIPYSFIYTKPGEPSVRMTAIASGPVEAGKPLTVKVRLAKADQSPVLHSDLLVMHTQPIHLLIEEPGLGDYHHEHPVPTKTPGEYEFTFTPKKSAPYRIWADIVLETTGVQELPSADLPSAGQAEPVTDTATRFTSEAGGYQFTLTLAGGNDAPPKAGQARAMTIKVTDAASQPTTQLEPVMSAFAHLVGFYGDFQTVVHLHPTGGDVLDEKLRGGPSLGFLFFPPKAGFIRLYCQVNIGGKMLFAPFNVNVEQ
jgi:mRNA-degrading endonuclease toxin of MazEF toxin-antitoxin module